MYRYVALGVITLLLGFSTGWKTQGWRLGKEIAQLQEAKIQESEKAQREAVAREQEYRQLEKKYQANLARAQEKRNAEVANINAKLNGTLIGLRNRPERTVYDSDNQVSSATSACVGATGAELASGDAEFLARFAADAAKLDAELTKCQAAYDSLTSQ